MGAEEEFVGRGAEAVAGALDDPVCGAVVVVGVDLGVAEEVDADLGAEGAVGTTVKTRAGVVVISRSDILRGEADTVALARELAGAA